MEQTNPLPDGRRELNRESDHVVVPRSLAYLPLVCSVFSFAIPLICFLAWVTDYPPLAVWMNPMTSVGLMLASAILWFLGYAPENRAARWVSRVFLSLLILLAM